MMGVMHGMSHGKHVLGSALWGPKCVKNGKSAANDGVIDSHILVKHILNFDVSIFLRRH
jgi:hypothetical protein